MRGEGQGAVTGSRRPKAKCIMSLFVIGQTEPEMDVWFTVEVLPDGSEQLIKAICLGLRAEAD